MKCHNCDGEGGVRITSDAGWQATLCRDCQRSDNPFTRSAVGNRIEYHDVNDLDETMADMVKLLERMNR